MKVLLADPPRREEEYDAAYPNMGILYLIASARQRFAGSGFSFEYLESQYDLPGHLDAIERARPDLYGLSYASFTSPLAHRTIAAVRARFPNLPIVTGGAHPTAAWEAVLRETPADLCVIGEGEAGLGDVIAHYAGSGMPLEQIPGIAYRRDGEPFRTPARPPIRDLDSIPMPAWDLVDFSKYQGMHLKCAEPQTYVAVSRGCPFDCWFCSNPIWKESKPWVRLRGAESIAREVEHLYQRGIREVYLSADEFNVNDAWPLGVARAIQGLGRRDMYFQCNVRADRVTPELAREFAKMNVWMVHIGVESGNQRTIDGLKKHIWLEQVMDACRVFQANGIKVFGFFMLYHAWEEKGELAYETPTDVNNTLRFGKRLLREKLINYMSWQVATPYPGSRLWETAQKYDLLLDGRRFGDVRERAMRLPGVSDKDVRGSLRWGYILKSWYALKSGHIHWKHLTRVRQNLAVILGQDWMKRSSLAAKPRENR
jgi:anaerobic magnesium-protoporphyrin IX monomethyl ester cyclase